VPGMKQYRGRRFNPYLAFRSRRPFPPPYFYSPYGYGYVLRLSFGFASPPPHSLHYFMAHCLPFRASCPPAERLLGSEGQTVICHTTEDDVSAHMGFFIWTDRCWNFFVLIWTIMFNLVASPLLRCIPYVIIVVWSGDDMDNNSVTTRIVSSIRSLAGSSR